MPALAYMLVQVEHGTIDKVSQKLMKFKEISDLHHLYGEFDIIVKVEADSPAHLQDFVANKIRPIKNIRSTQTLITSDVF